MAEPSVTTESVKYALDGAVVIANRREVVQPTGGDPTVQWVFSLPQVLSSNGVVATNFNYQELVVDSEEDRDEKGSDLIDAVLAYKNDLKAVQDELTESLAKVFPPVPTPTTTAGGFLVNPVQA